MSDVGSVTVSNVASATVYSGIEGAVVASMSSRFCDDVQRNSMSFACVSALARSVDRYGARWGQTVQQKGRIHTRVFSAC
jgi:hypothetical protein